VRQRFLNFLETIRSNYWFVPGMVLVAMVIAAEGLIRIDRLLIDSAKDLPDWVPQLRPGVAEQMLLTIANASVALASLVFSITLIVLTLTAGNYGPRLIRRFLSDTPTQVVLGLYTGTLVYCLLVLRSTAAVGDERFIPHLAVLGAMVLAIADVMMLTYFVNHMSGSIHATNMIWSVTDELDSAIEELFPQELGEDEREVALPRGSTCPETKPWMLEASRAGYLRGVDADGLMRLAKEHDLVISMPRIGTFVGPVPVAKVWRATEPDDELTDDLRVQFMIGQSRTALQDVVYSLDRLVEMAARALSPGVNDPFTALTCIDHFELAFSRLAKRQFPSAERFDDEDRLRIITDPVTFDHLLKRTFDPIRQYGCGQMLVSRRLLEVLGTIVRHARSAEHRDAALGAAMRVWQSCSRAQADDPLLPDLEALYQDVIGAGEPKPQTA